MTRLLLVGLAVAGAAGHAGAVPPPGVREEPVPAWVEEVALDVEGEAEPGAPVTQLLSDRQLRLPEVGPPSLWSRFAYRIESRAALDEWSSFSVAHDPGYQRVALHRVRVHRDGAVEDRLPRTRLEVLRRGGRLEEGLYDRDETLLAVLEDVRPGDVVDVAFSIDGTNPVLGEHFSAALDLRWGLPVRRAHVRVLAHRSRPLEFRVVGGSDPLASTSHGPWSETRWEARGLPAAEPVFDAPLDWEPLPVLRLTEHGSWGDVARWALPLYGIARPPPPELREVAADIAAREPDPAGRVRLARDWVQEHLRYFAVLLDEHSHAPHAPAEVLARRYGDCKDKAVVLVSLLDALGIEAWPALVNTARGRAIEAWLPSPLAFDHVIVAARAGDETVWIDPTLTLQGGRATSFLPPYGVALEVRAKADALTRLPESRPGSTRIEYEYRVPEELNPASVTIVTEFRGHLAERMRADLAAAGPAAILERWIAHYAEPQLGVEPVGELGVEDSREENRLRVTERYRIDRKSAPGAARTFATLPLEIAGDLPIPDANPRAAPLALPYPHERVEVVRLRTAGPVTFDDVAASIRNAWFQFSARSEREADGFRVTYRLRTVRDRVEPDQLAGFAAEATRMVEELGYSIHDAEGPEPPPDAWPFLVALAVAAVALAATIAGGAVIAAWIAT